jgi:hypothetical protein
MRCLLLLLVCISLLINRVNCSDILSISPSVYQVSTQANYQVFLLTTADIMPLIGSTITISFPSDYQGRLTAVPCSINIINWPSSIGTVPSLTCSFTNLVLTISNAFTTGETYPSGNPFIFEVVGPTNPFSTQKTGTFTLGFTLDSGMYSATADGFSCQAGTMTCSLSTSPTKVNSVGQLLVSFLTVEFPAISTLVVQTDADYWLRAQPQLSAGSEIIQSPSLTCTPILNSNSGMSCSYQHVGGKYQITISNIVNSTLNSTSISFSIASILTPPTTEPQDSFTITSFYNGSSMSVCYGAYITTTTAGSISVGSYSSSVITVNAAGVGTLNFVVHSDIIASDTIAITFPVEMSLANLTSVYINNGGNTSTPTITNQSMTLTAAIANAGNTISIQFTNIINPPSEATTHPFQITTYRNGYSI